MKQKNYNLLNRKQLLLIALFSMGSVFFLSSFVSDKKEAKQNKEWKCLLADGKDAFKGSMGSWVIENQTLELPVKNADKDRADVWLKNEYCDFEIQFEFQLSATTNSGIFVRTAKVKDPVNTGIEIQLRDDYGKKPIDSHFCGSIYECSVTRKNSVKKAGEWNTIHITCKGSKIKVVLNGKKVNDIDLNDWKEVGKNPDGSLNKFKKAYKDMPLCGSIGFQDHGGMIKIRELMIRELN
jgi:hypothetical protein